MPVARHPSRGAFWLAVTIAVLAFAIAGCGSSNDNNTSSSAASTPAASTSTPAAAAPADAPASASGFGDWLSRSVGEAGRSVVEGAWNEVRSLVRITRIEHPEAMLIAPDQAFFLRENMKLRLLNARLSLLARQSDAAQADVRWVKGAIERYADRSARRTQIALDLLLQVAQQARQLAPARPDDTFAALAAAAGSR